MHAIVLGAFIAPSFFVNLSAAKRETAAPSVTLDQALTRAYAQRASLRAARLRVDALVYARTEAGYGPRPTLLLGATPKGDPTGGSEDLALTIPLDLFGRTDAARREAESRLGVARVEFRQTQLEVQSEVLVRFAEATTAATLRENAQLQLGIAERILRATQTRVEEGFVPGVQLQRAELEVARARRILNKRSEEARLARRRLAAALGEAGESVPSGEAIDVPRRLALDDASPASTSEVELRRAVLAESQAVRRTVRTSARPELQLETRRAPWFEGRDGIYTRLQLSIPLGKDRPLRAALQSAAARERAAQADLEESVAQSQAAIDAARIELQAAEQELQALAESVRVAQDLAERAELGLREGALNLTEALEATRTVRETEEAYAEAQRRRGVALAELLRVRGVLVPVSSEVQK